MIPRKLNLTPATAIAFIAGVAITVVAFLMFKSTSVEGFRTQSGSYCYKCSKNTPCGCGGGKNASYDDKTALDLGTVQNIINRAMQDASVSTTCPQVRCPDMQDMSKFVLKATVPPCPPIPDMSKYMLKTECPPQPDMSKYVLKSSVPQCPPCIASCSKPCKIGDCPPCPRPRCPVINCPPPRACAPCASVEPPRCPEPQVKCKTTYEERNQVRPMLASTANFGM